MTNSPGSPGWPRRLLIVEDDEPLGRVLSIVLEHPSRAIDLVGTLSSGRKAMSRGRYDLLLLDLNLPDGNGADLLRHVRDDLGLDLPVIVLIRRPAARCPEPCARLCSYGSSEEAVQRR